MDKVERLNLAQKILLYLQKASNKKATDIAKEIKVDKQDVNSVLYSELKKEVEQDSNFRWSLKGVLNDSDSLEDRVINCLKGGKNLKAIDIAKKIGVDRKEVNSLLYGKLKKKCVKDAKHQWKLVIN